MTMRFLLTLLSLFLVAGTAWSDQVALRPPDCAVELRSYGFGLIPLDGKFARFDGWLHYDPANSAACEVELEIDAGSLVMESDPIRQRITGASMMDVVRFPALSFRGSCQGQAKEAVMTGDLTMHGQTHPVTLEYTRSAGNIVATGHLRRAEWGITGSPLVGGPTIRFRMRLPDPFDGRHT